MGAHVPAGGAARAHMPPVGPGRGGRDAVSKTEVTFILGLLCFATITAVWISRVGLWHRVEPFDLLETLNPEPETLGPKSDTLDPKPYTLNPES